MNNLGQQALVLAALAAGAVGCDDASTSQQAQTTSATSTPVAATTTSAAPGAGGDHHDHAMPQAMLDACNGKKSGDVCTVNENGNSRDGKCNAPPTPPGATAATTQLACMPSGGPVGGPGGDHHPH